MSVLPVIVRELRSQARQPLTHWLRIIGGLSVVAAILAALWSIGAIKPQAQSIASPNLVQAFGTTLFGKMNLFIFLAIWLFVPLATADAVSRERREGTLPLLYLTELHSFGIVVGKAFVHMLRSVSLFLTMVPWLLLPLVFGGVSVNDVALAMMLDASSVLLAQSAGLLASTIPRDWLKSAILALSFALVLLLTMLNAHGGLIRESVRIGTPAGLGPGTRAFWNSPLAQFYDQSQDGILGRTRGLIELTTNASVREHGRWYRGYPGFILTSAETTWGELWTSLTSAGRAHWFRGVAVMVFASGLVLLGATWAGAWRIERSWRDAPAQLFDSELRRRFLSPRFRVESLKRNLSRSLSANPIGWLQHYSPSGRMVKWGWCFFIIIVEIIFSRNPSDLYGAQAGLGLLLLLGLTFSATSSFREELETGAFELLLVTPLRERQIIAGRVRGLWRQFLPAILVYGSGSIYLATGWSNGDLAGQAWQSLARTLAGFCTLPLIGLYFSVRRWNFFAAWLAACVIGLLPVAVARAFGVTDRWLIPLQIGVALAAVALLQKRLQEREFLQKGS